uniref:BTB/POZ domain-containing protein 6 isoform X2 n=1 Tax=Ictidomys tridecemlineatus TaxID=43179 RepID=UPI001A9E5C98|nr:BTB/POZ domain-containing protein 6 isoform X2 [Ictidomys tridecemlineatus]
MAAELYPPAGAAAAATATATDIANSNAAGAAAGRKASPRSPPRPAPAPPPPAPAQPAPDNNNPESPNWQSFHPTLRERNALMFNNELMADVHFIVGPLGAARRVPAHKYVLAVGSSVFYAMFYGDLAEVKSEIHIPDVEPAAFLVLLKNLHFLRTKFTWFSAVVLMLSHLSPEQHQDSTVTLSHPCRASLQHLSLSTLQMELPTATGSTDCLMWRCRLCPSTLPVGKVVYLEQVAEIKEHVCSRS